MDQSSSFNLQLTFLCQWPLDWVTRMIWSLVLSSRWRVTPSQHQMAIMALSRWRHLVASHPVNHPSLWQGSKCLPTAWRLGIVWKSKLSWLKMRGTTAPPTHAWQVTMVEDMLWDGKSGLMEVVVTGPGQAILSYGRQSLGEGLSLGKAWDAPYSHYQESSFGLVSKPKLNANTVSLWEGWWLIAHTINEQHIEARGPGHPYLLWPASPLFTFHNQDKSTQGEARLPTAEEWLEVPRHKCQTLYHEQGWALQCGWDHGHRQQDPWAALTLSPSLSPDHRFETDSTSLSTSSSVLSRSDRSGGSGHQHHGWCCWEPRGHLIINLPVFKDEDKKDTVTYQSWH